MPTKDTIAIHLVREALEQSLITQDLRNEILAKVGVDQSQLEDNSLRISASRYAQLWRLLAKQTDDEFFGMDSRRLKKGSLKFLCQCAMAQPTVGEGLKAGVKFLSLALEDLDAKIIRSKNLAEIVFNEKEITPHRAFTYFTFLMIVHGVHCWLAGRRIKILAIELKCAKPEYCDDYRVMFSQNLKFNCTQSRMIFAAEHLDSTTRRNADELHTFVSQAPANILVKYRDPTSLASRIRRYLRRVPTTEWADTKPLAQSLCMSDSTLRRRLAEEGITYQTIKNSVRKELALEWINGSSLSIAEVAAHLGFAEPSSFYKAFKKWTGAKPSDFRRREPPEQSPIHVG